MVTVVVVVVVVSYGTNHSSFEPILKNNPRPQVITLTAQLSGIAERVGRIHIVSARTIPLEE